MSPSASRAPASRTSIESRAMHGPPNAHTSLPVTALTAACMPPDLCMVSPIYSTTASTRLSTAFPLYEPSPS